MKQKLCFLLVIVFFAVSAQLYSLEVQLFAGPETGFIGLDENINFWSKLGVNNFFFKGNNTSKYWAVGVSLGVRLYTVESDMIAVGFVFRDRALFAINYRETGTLSLNGETESWSGRSYSVFKDDFSMSFMDFDLGISYKFNMGKRVSLLAEFGVNLTIMDYEEYDGKFTVGSFNYLGGGIFGQLALQVNLTDRMYLEFGLNGILNAFSSLKGKLYVGDPYFFIPQKIEYTGTGRWDSRSIAAYLQVGWRFRTEPIK
ncbi:MAG: hypothetical protein LBI14_06395 [Treponema sp.]|jgi:hypothetical protein|nr:hypothetical protein [Treponema sp.]